MLSKIVVDVFPLLLFVLVVFGAKFVKPLSSLNLENYLSIETCLYYRGLFAIVIIFHHLANLTGDGVLFSSFSLIGASAVAFFFFLSGYGLQLSYMKKNDIYRKEFLKKRLPKILIPYIIIIGLYWVMYLILGRYFSIKDIILSFINGNPIAAYSWFIVNILIFYIVFWFLMLICKKHYFFMIIGGIVWYGFYVAFCINMNYSSVWYKSSHLLIIGMFWATYENKIKDLIKKNYIIPAMLSFFCFLSYYIFWFIVKTMGMSIGDFSVSGILLYISRTFFVVSMLILFMKLRIGNRILNFLGTISLELYITHGLFVFAFRSGCVYIKDNVIYCLSVLTGTVLLSYCLHLLFQIILNKVYKNYSREVKPPVKRV